MQMLCSCVSTDVAVMWHSCPFHTVGWEEQSHDEELHYRVGQKTATAAHWANLPYLTLRSKNCGKATAMCWRTLKCSDESTWAGCQTSTQLFSHFPSSTGQREKTWSFLALCPCSHLDASHGLQSFTNTKAVLYGYMAFRKHAAWFLLYILYILHILQGNQCSSACSTSPSFCSDIHVCRVASHTFFFFFPLIPHCSKVFCPFLKYFQRYHWLYWQA